MIAMLKRQSGTMVYRLWSNNSIKFVNSAIEKFSSINGIIYETTNPYQPEHNSIAEWAITIFLKIMWSMLHSANLDLHYWGEAFLYAVHIQFLTVTVGLEGKVPYEAWTGCKPNISHVWIFGSLR